MKEYIKEKLPTWYKNINSDDKIILTNDIDALLSYYYLHKKFGCTVGGFYTFKEIYFCTDKRKSLIGVDMDTIVGKTFGNHLTHFYKNEDAINLNNQFNLKYYQKFPLNTALIILSLYGFDIESFTDEQLKIILAIDSAYKGYYTDNDFYRDVYTTWLNRLDIRFLEDRILKNMTVQDFKEIQRKYNLSGNIIITNDSTLATSIYLDKLREVFNDIIKLPQDKFNLHRSYTYKVINPKQQAIPPRNKLISMAWTFNNELKMTLK